MKNYILAIIVLIFGSVSLAQQIILHCGKLTHVRNNQVLEVGPKVQATFAGAYKAGVKIAVGTDAGVFMHGMNRKEFAYRVDGEVPAFEAFWSATLNTSELLDVSATPGSIEKGKLADIIAVNGDPFKDINAMEKVIF